MTDLRRFPRHPGARSKLAAFLLASLIVTAPARAALIDATWLGGSGSWSDPTGWDSNPQYPDNGVDTFDVTVGTSGTVTLDVDATIQTLSLQSANLTGTNDLDLNGVFTWLSGTHSSTAAAGTTTVNGLELTGTSSKTLDERNLVNNGTANHRGGIWTLRDGASFENAGSFFSDSDAGAGGSGTNLFIGSSGSAANSFVNSGSFFQSGSQTTSLSPSFDNSGSAVAQAGQLNLNGGGTGTGGSYSADAGAVLNFGGGTHTLDAASSLSGAGEIRISSGNVSHAGSTAVTGTLRVNNGILTLSGASGSTADLDMAGGQLVVSTGALDVTGDMNWTGGQLGGAGTTTVNGSTEITGTSSKTIDDQTFVNAGSATHRGGILTIRDNGTFDNQGTFTSDSSLGGGGTGVNLFIGSAGGNPNVFDNSGSFVKAGAQDTTVSARFDTSGSVDVQSGELNLNGGGTGSGSSVAVASGASLSFGGGTHTWDAGSSISGAGELVFDGGSVSHAGGYTVTGTTRQAGATTTLGGGSGQTGDLLLESGTLNVASGSFTASGATTWTGATLTGAGTTVLNGGVDLTGTSSKTLDAHALEVSGSSLHSGGILTLRSGATLTNTGIFTSDSSSGTGANLFIGAAGGGTNTFVNQGTFQQAGSQITQVSPFFENSGTVEVSAGTLRVTSSYTQTAGVTRLSGGTLDVSTVDIQGGIVEGEGLLDGDLLLGGRVEPGASTGELDFSGDILLSTTAEIEIEIAGIVQGVSFDFLDVAGAATLDGQLSVGFLGGFDSVVQGSDVFTVLEADLGLTGAFTNVASGDRLTTNEGHSFQVDYGVGSPFGVNVVTLSNFQAVPEPSTALLVGSGLAALGLRRRRWGIG